MESTVLNARLESLRDQFRECVMRMEELDNAQQELREEMLRISGAAEVLEELLGAGGASATDDGRSAIPDQVDAAAVLDLSGARGARAPSASENSSSG